MLPKRGININKYIIRWKKNSTKKRKSNDIDLFKFDKENKNIFHYLFSNNNSKNIF